MGEQVAVSSTIYNLAGPESKRPQFLRSLILGGIMQEADSLGEVISTGYHNGPGLRLRQFGKWARNNEDLQDEIGITFGDIRLPPVIDRDILAENIPVDSGYTPRIDWAEISAGNLLYWARQYVAVNHPDLLNTGWTWDYNEDTNEVTITYIDLSTESFTPAFYDSDIAYLYVGYTPIIEGTFAGPLVFGTIYTLDEGDPWPLVDGWTENIYTVTPVTVNLNFRDDIVTTYSDDRDSRTNVVEWVESTTYDELLAQYEQTVYHGSAGATIKEIYSERTVRNFYETGEVISGNVETITEDIDIGGGVTAHKVTTRTYDSIEMTRQYQDGLQHISYHTWGDPQILIYKEGDGNEALDAFFNSTVSAGSFLPPIPFRLKNKPVTEIPYRWTVDFGRTDGVSNFSRAEGTGEDVLFARSPDAPIKDWRLGLFEEDPISTGIFVGTDGYRDLDTFHTYAAGWEVLQAQLSDIFRNAVDPPYWSHDHGETWTQLPSIPEGSTATYESLAEVTEKAFKRATAGDFYDVLDKINDNENILDIDYAYAVFGVSFNVEENACKKYVYKFFKNLMDTTGGFTLEEEEDWWEAFYEINASKKEYEEWIATQGSGPPEANDLDHPPPSNPEYPTIPVFKLSVYSQHPDTSLNYRTEMCWTFMHEITGTGLGKAGAKKGDLWFEVLADPVSDLSTVAGFELANFNQKVVLWWQDGHDTWRKLVITGMYHRNLIYKNKAVHITAKEALEDDEESGFIVPLHEDIYKAMGMVDMTQMATACCLLVFNCYEIHKERWYETGLFKVLLILFIIIVSIIVTVATGGAAGIGILGSAQSVGTALGLSGTAALVAGAAINAVAGLIVSFIVTEAAVAIFGEEIGRIIGTFLAFIVTFGLTSFANGLEFTNLFTKPDGLIALTSAVGKGASDVMNVMAKNIQEDTIKLMEKVGKDLAEIQRKYNEEFAKWRAVDPANIAQYISELTQKPETFLARTLMTGSDIIDLNLQFLHQFAELNTSLELP